MPSTPPNSSQLNDLIQRLFLAEQEYRKIAFGGHPGQALGEPLSNEKVERLERDFSFRFPPSYRQFLLLHDGWKGFRGDADLLSSTQMRQQVIVSRIEDFKQSAQSGDVSQTFIIVAGETSSYFVYLDPGTRREDGEMDVVEYTIQEGEVDRYPDLFAYLSENDRLTRILIAREKGISSDAETNP
jgi:hypothetical protein